MLLGSHCSTAGGVWTALERAESIGAESCQIFVKNNMQWFGKPLAEPDVQRFFKLREKLPVRVVFAHSGYLINLGGPDSPNRVKSIRSLIEELNLAGQLNLPFLVLHPGAHLGTGTETGLAQVVAGLNEVFLATKGLKVRVALENTAGQGTCLGGNLEDLSEIMGRVKHSERLGICLDTAHLFASGHDVRSPEGWNKVISKIKRLVGLDQILAFHLNDSKPGLGSHVDRHEHIGKGQIGLEAFRHIVNDKRFLSVPGCLETPKSEDLHEDRENLAALRSLLAK